MTTPIHSEIERMIRGMFDDEGREAFTHDKVELVAAVRHLLVEVDRLRAEREQADAPEPDLSGWSTEENVEFEELYGVQAAMRLRASNNRVWQIVHELRSEAADAGLDPYQDPMAQRLSAALVGVDGA